MEFTESDRKFIRQIAKSYGALDERLKKIESIVLEPELSPMQVEDVIDDPTLDPAKKQPSNLKSLFGGELLPADQTIEVVFKDKQGDEIKQRILIESLYKTLKELCEKNRIDTLQIRIKT
jgi:hypothetical protein